MLKPDKHLFEFGAFLLDPAERRLLRDGRPVPLTPKGFDLLVALVRHSGRLLEKDELIKQLWPDSIVEEGNLTFNVSMVRKALGDERNGQRYIETIPKRGYRFVAPVREQRDQVAAPGEETFLRAQTSLEGKAEPVSGRPQEQVARILLHKPPPLARWMLWTAPATLVVGVAAMVFLRHRAQLKWAQESVARVEELAQSGRYFEAYDLAVAARRYLPTDPTLARLLPTISDDLSVSTDPPGADIHLRRFFRDASGNFPAKQFIGTTPIRNLLVARGEYLLYSHKDGYEPAVRTISSALMRSPLSFVFGSPAIHIDQKLIEAGKAPDRMVFIPGGPYKLVSYGRPGEATVQLDDYFLDTFEVTNREYKEFLDAGGYLKKEYWKHAFEKGGKALAWDEGMRAFKDRTGLPGPRSWVSGSYPERRAEHPVTDVSWYEAAAYCAFRDKGLPTVFQWEKASRVGTFSKFGWVMPWGLENDEMIGFRANFNSHEPAPVDSFEFGTSPFGAYNMAGNVSEWCLNKKDQGFITAGGSWADPPYVFGQYGQFPGFYSSAELGLRCVRNSPKAAEDQGGMPFSADDVPTYRPTGEGSFQGWLSHYRYDHTPLREKVEEVAETQTWRRERISYAGANEDRATAYLYLPRNSRPPFQVIHFIPGISAFRSITVPQYVDMLLLPYISAGRAVFVVVLSGYVERKWPPGHEPPDVSSVKYRHEMVNWATDVRRGLDYLETRSEIDPRKIALFNISEERFLIVPAVESRYRSVVLVGIGLTKSWLRAIPEANPIYFAPHIQGPKLMLHGRFDETDPLKSGAEPLYKLLREPKQLEVFSGGHVPPPEVSVPIVNAWLDKTLGPVPRD